MVHMSLGDLPLYVSDVSPSDVVPGTTKINSSLRWLRCMVCDDLTRFQLLGESHVSIIIPRSVAQKGLEACSPKT